MVTLKIDCIEVQIIYTQKRVLPYIYMFSICMMLLQDRQLVPRLDLCITKQDMKTSFTNLMQARRLSRAHRFVVPNMLSQSDQRRVSFQ